MTRHAAFPNIWVKGIGIRQPPFDEPTTMDELVRRGATREFLELRRANKLEEETVQEVIDSLEEMIGPFRDSHKLEYQLLIRTMPTRDMVVGGPIEEFDGWLKDRTVSARARAFARAKNPFEPDLIEVDEPRYAPSISSDRAGDLYDVDVTVTK